MRRTEIDEFGVREHTRVLIMALDFRLQHKKKE